VPIIGYQIFEGKKENKLAKYGIV